jgi:hypothetical protein
MIMRGIADSKLRRNYAVALAAFVINGMTIGCSSQASPADLTIMGASTAISQRWAHDELNHFKIVFHSDTLIECGVTNDLWKAVETTDRGYTRTSYQLTERGSKVLFAIDLKESGKGHEVTLRGPYALEILNISQGVQPDTRRVDLQWNIDWEKAPADLKACLPKFELSGHESALFKLNQLDWNFVSYLSPEDAAQPPAPPALP